MIFLLVWGSWLGLESWKWREHQRITPRATPAMSDQEWEFCNPYLTLMDPEASQRCHLLRALFNALR